MRYFIGFNHNKKQKWFHDNLERKCFCLIHEYDNSKYEFSGIILKMDKSTIHYPRPIYLEDIILHPQYDLLIKSYPEHLKMLIEGLKE